MEIQTVVVVVDKDLKQDWNSNKVLVVDKRIDSSVFTFLIR